MKPLFVMVTLAAILLLENCKNKSPVHHSSSAISTCLKSISDTNELLTTFFSPVKITSEKVAIWKPGLDDYFNMELSMDSLCHTQLDTIIPLNSKKYLLFFRTDTYSVNGHKITCHVCSPMYSIATVEPDSGHYTITNFKKSFFAAGSFGNGYDTLQVENFGQDYQLIHFSSSYVGTSTVTNTSTYFEPEYYKQVFSFWNYREVGDSTGVDPSRDYSLTEQHLVKIPGEPFKDRNDIELTGYHAFYDRIKKRIIKKRQIEFYRADDFGNYKRTLH